MKKSFKTNIFFPLNSWFYKYEIYKEIFLADVFLGLIIILCRTFRPKYD